MAARPRRPFRLLRRAGTRTPPSRHTKVHETPSSPSPLKACSRGNEAVETLTKERRGRLMNYLRLTGSKLGLLVNFAAYPKAAVEQWAN